jgi:hypothetical protein
MQTYWDRARPGVDICALTNVVRAFYKYDRGTEVKQCPTYISNALNPGR